MGDHIWKDLMAYLNSENISTARTKGHKASQNRGKALLKRGFVVTSCPKKVWAICLPNSSIDNDDEDNKWFQIGSDMLIMDYTELCKYRNKIGCVQEFGLKKLLVIQWLKKNNDTNIEVVDGIDNVDVDDTNDIDKEDGEYCCAGDLCGISVDNSCFILKASIKHRCIVCKGTMHGGVCGAEANTVLKNVDLGTMAVIVSPVYPLRRQKR